MGRCYPCPLEPTWVALESSPDTTRTHTDGAILPGFSVTPANEITNKMVFKGPRHLDVIDAYRYQVNLISGYCLRAGWAVGVPTILSSY